ncbi:MAG: hypothetical protein F6J93_15290 [Oscillatoria sp. SIO1A7]|nr:hypothetical protein [Oscillatoria sp. SIO1A7]
MLFAVGEIAFATSPRLPHYRPMPNALLSLSKDPMPNVQCPIPNFILSLS